MSELITREVIRKLNRLGTMRPRELAHRVREKVYSELDRISGSTGLSNRSALILMPFKNYLKGGPASRFYRSHRENLARRRD
ncbi:MAG: hypothetical protein NTY38_23515 [Acidobacteria bacterium]|nr:hypothetical protein [Acidobacteriota bacterium]